MKKILFALLAFPTFASAGTFTLSGSSMTITFSTGIASGAQSIAFDSSTTGSFTTTFGNFNAQCNSCSTMIVGIASPNTNVQVSSITYGGVSFVLSTATYDAGNGQTEIWYTTATPASGTSLLKVNWPSSVQFEAVPMTFTGTKVSAPIDASTGTIIGASAAITSSMTVVNANEWVAGIAYQNNQTALFPGGGETRRGGYDTDIVGFFGAIACTKGPIATVGIANMTERTTSWSQPAFSTISIVPGP